MEVSNTSCKPTYEGLKYYCPERREALRIRCKPTYEGLRCGVAPRARGGFARLQAYL